MNRSNFSSLALHRSTFQAVKTKILQTIKKVKISINTPIRLWVVLGWQNSWVRTILRFKSLKVRTLSTWTFFKTNFTSSKSRKTVKLTKKISKDDTQILTFYSKYCFVNLPDFRKEILRVYISSFPLERPSFICKEQSISDQRLALHEEQD
jgi:hypothetical protein